MRMQIVGLYGESQVPQVSRGGGVKIHHPRCISGRLSRLYSKVSGEEVRRDQKIKCMR